TISPHDHNQVYVGSQFAHQTTDGGNSWQVISPDLTLNDKSRQGFFGGLTGDNICVEYAGVVFAIPESPKEAGTIWAGTNDGQVQFNLPHAPVYWITVQERFNDLVISTYGRGFWILDDITPIQQMTAQVKSSNFNLFPVHATYRFRGITVPYASAVDPTAGQNPPYGASINYYLKTTPNTEASIKIIDAKGNAV